MGQIDVMREQMRKLDMKDIADLCLLGLLFDDMRTENGLLTVIRNMQLGNWQPVREVIEIALERLLESGYVDSLNSDAQIYYSITGSGNRYFFSLIRRPLPFDPIVRNNSVVLKSYFVETVPGVVRKCVVDDLVGYYNCQLCALQDGCGMCPLNSKHEERKVKGHMIQIKQELEWLQSLT